MSMKREEPSYQEDYDAEALVWSTVVPQTSRVGIRGTIRRCWNPLTHPELGVEGCRTMYEAFRRGVNRNPLGPCLGFRAVSTSGLATPYIYSSYSECLARVDSFSAGLDTMQLVQPNDDGMLVLGLYMKNCMEWVLSEHGIFSLGGVTCPLYDTLGPDTVRFVLSQTGAKSVVCTRAELKRLCQVKASGTTPRFLAVIVVDGITPEAERLAQEVGLEIHSYAKVEAVGAHRRATRGHKHRPPSADDVATFCYTSGTTGDPKGALVTHQNIISAIVGMHPLSQLKVLPTDRHLSYMPLPHIFERVVLSQLLLAGGSVAFYRGDPTLLIEDLQACRPTVLIAAPRVLNRIHDKIMGAIAEAGGLKKKIFDAALATKSDGLQRHGRLSHGLYDRLVFNKIRKGLGMDHLRFLISGSAPLSDNVMSFFRCLLGVPVIEGYGQTEGAAAATLGTPDDMTTTGHVGGPTGVAEIVLVDVPEMGYFHADRSHRGQPCWGRGEICIRGPNVFKGYYKDPEKTKEAIDDEGWLHSGDIGLWRPDGNLQIIDRKKNLFKLSHGEYVAPEKIENVLTRSPLIAQCFVYGDTFQSCLVAVVVPDEEHVRVWAGSMDKELARAQFETICQNDRLQEAIIDDIQRLSRENSLHGFETVRAVHIEHRHFSVENDLLTPTFKLVRHKVRDRYEKELDQLYAGLPSPRSRL